MYGQVMEKEWVVAQWFNSRWYLLKTYDGDRKGIWSKLLPCASKNPIYLGRHVRAFEQGSQQVKFRQSV